MTRSRLLVALFLLVASCAPEGTTGSTIGASSTTTQPATTTTAAGPEGVDLDLFRDGLVPSARGYVDDLIGTAPFYTLDLTLADDLASITGTETVLYTNQEDVGLDEVVFRLFPNIADGTSVVTDVTVDGVAVTPTLQLMDSVMRIPLGAELLPGDQVELAMTIDVTVPAEEGGNYGTFLVDDEILAAAHFYPMVAVFDDEGWNYEIPAPSGDVVYADASFFLVDIHASDTLPIVTSGRLAEKTAPDSEGLGTRTYAAGPVRDFYLAASTRFVPHQTRIGDTVINSYAPADFATGNASVAELARSALAEFIPRYGEYPYTELDLVSTGTAALGVEYPGAIALHMGNYDPSFEFDEPTIVSTVIHEVAHQWFYGTIGNDQLDEPWLDESMAQYATWVYWRDTQGPGADEAFRAYLDSRWARVDHEDIPIGLPVAAYEGLEYGAIVYGRGPLFVDDLAGIVGADDFDEFLSDYTDRFRFGVVTTDDYRALAEAHCGCDLGDIFTSDVYPR
jgi:hypothetical protein